MSGSRPGPRRPNSGTRGWQDWMIRRKVTGWVRPNMRRATMRGATTMRSLPAFTTIHRRASSQMPGSGASPAKEPWLGWRPAYRQMPDTLRRRFQASHATAAGPSSLAPGRPHSHLFLWSPLGQHRFAACQQMPHPKCTSRAAP
jgi:hypothetical protein